MKLLIKQGTTSKRIGVYAADSTSVTGGGLTGLTYNTAGLKAYYWRESDGNVAGTAITLATATLGTYTSGGFIVKDGTNMPGEYEFGIPNAILAAGCSWAQIIIWGAANMVPVRVEIQLTTFDFGGQEATNLAMSAGSSIYKGSVIGASPTSTTIVDTGLTAADANAYNGRVIIFTSGACQYQASTITAYTPSSNLLTFNSLTRSPAQNDTYIIV